MAAVAQYLVQDSFPVDKLRIDAQETKYYEIQSGCVESRNKQTVKEKQTVTAKQTKTEKPSSSAPAASSPSSLVSEIAKARQQIKQSLDDGTGSSSVAADNDVAARLNSLSLENTELKRVTDDLAALVKKLEARVAALEGGKAPAPAAAPKAVEKPVSKQEEKAEEDDDDDDDDDIDLFGSDDSEDEEAKERIKEARVAAYNAKKAKKPVLIAKSSVLLDVKPWDDETDMAALEAEVRTIEMDGLLWGASKLVAVGYGIKKLQIMCVVEDEKVSIDDLSETICEFEDYVQSVDIAAFSKI